MQCNWGMWMVCGSNTPLDEGANSPTLASQRSANALWEVSDQHFQKNSSYSPFETHICWRFTISQLKKLAVAKPRPSPGTETCSDLRTKTSNALGLKAIASEIEKTTCTSCTLDHQLTFVLHMLKNANCVNCGTSVSRLRVRICSETRSDGLRQSFKNRQLFSDRTVAGVSPQLHHVATFSDVSRFVA